MHGFFIVGQTISSLIYFINNTCLLKLVQLCKLVSLFILFISLLTSCSSQVPQKKITKEVMVTKDSSSQILNAEQTIALAQEMIANKNVDTAAINEATKSLVNASFLYFQEKNYSKAIWLADPTLRLNSKSAIENITLPNQHLFQATQLMQLMLIKAMSYQALNFNDLSYQELENIFSLAHQHNLTLTYDYYQLRSKVLLAKNKAIASLQASLYAFSLNDYNSDDLIEDAKG